VIALMAALAAAWVALLVAAPILPVPLAAALYAAGAHICHQRPERSFHLFAAQLPVCARCLGIYAGGAAGALLATGARARAAFLAASPRTLLVSGAMPTVVTLAAEWSGIWRGANAGRALAGLPLGFVVALVVVQAAATLHYGGCAPRRPIASNRPPTPI
jgi:uncharacterized membrane protein